MGQTVAKQLALDDLQSQPPEMRIGPKAHSHFLVTLFTISISRKSEEKNCQG
jgi:hypothetical protein